MEERRTENTTGAGVLSIRTSGVCSIWQSNKGGVLLPSADSRTSKDHPDHAGSVRVPVGFRTERGFINFRSRTATSSIPTDLVQVKYEMLRQVQLDKRAASPTAKEFGFSAHRFTKRN